ncbi:hypothetical protein [Phormidesmis sp. 146-33]
MSFDGFKQKLGQKLEVECDRKSGQTRFFANSIATKDCVDANHIKRCTFLAITIPAIISRYKSERLFLD